MNSYPILSKKLLLVAGLFAASAGTLAAVSPADVYDDPLIGNQWQWDPERNGVNIADAWANGITGEGVVIGIIDQWVEPFHEDLNVSKYNTATDWQTADLSLGLSYDFMNPGFSPGAGDEQPYPELGHGTACAGMAAAVGGNEVGTVGAASGATIAGLNASLAGGISFSKGTAYWASGVSADGTYAGEAQIDVKSCSFGSSFRNSSGVNEDVELTSANNVIYCFAAMNERGVVNRGIEPSNTGWNSYGNIVSIINVASSASNGKYSTFSSYGSNVFIAAPGSSVYSADRTGENGYDDSNYTSWSGTSAATPLVAGVMALGKQVCPDMDVRWAKHALAWASGHNETPNIDPEGTFHYNWETSTGSWQKNNGGYWFNNNYGFGLVDAVGFVEATRDILYTTTETTFFSDKITKTATTETTGTVRTAEFSVGTGTGDLTENIETVSVRVNFSGDAQVDLDLSTLKVTLVAPDDASSIVVQGSIGDTWTTADEEWISYYTFLSNAFWGSSYGAEGWTVKVEYAAEDGVDTTDWVTVDSVEFTMGDKVFEAENTAVAKSKIVNAHAIALDSGSFSVAGTMRLEDSVLINAGTFELAESGTIAAYEEGVFGADKGVKYTQNGGAATIRGSATFKRGATLNGGELTLFNSVNAGTGMSVNGGTLTVGATEDEVSVGASLSVYGGKLVLAENAKFATALKVEGGAVELCNGVATKKIAVGKNAGKSDESAVGGSLVVSGTVSVAGGIQLAGTATGTFAAGSVVNNGSITLNGGSNIIWSGLLTVNKGVSVVDGALSTLEGTEASFAGAMTNEGILKISENAKITFTKDTVFTTGFDEKISLAAGSSLRLESGIADGNVLAGTLSGSGKLTLTQDTIFDANVDDFAGTLAIEDGVLSVEEGADLKVAAGATLELIVSDANDWLSLKVGDNGKLNFEKGSNLVIDFTEILGETSEFSVMSWVDGSVISGLGDLERGSGISLNVGGVSYKKENWYFEIADNELKVKLSSVVVDIEDKEQTAKLLADNDKDYVACFSANLKEYNGKISGAGEVKSVGDLNFSGDFDELQGTVYISGGTFAVSVSEAKLGKTQFVDYVIDRSGVLRLSDSGVSGKLRVAERFNFENKLSGAGTFATSGTITFSGDASAHTGTTKVESGTLTIAQSAKLGTGAFEIAGTLALVGDRKFDNATLGTGTLDIVSGKLTFTKNVGTATFNISSGASATFAGTSNGFAGMLTGAGLLTTTQDFTLSGDASGFSGKMSVTAGTFSVAENAKLGTGDFEIAGTLALNGTRTFANATSGDGKLEIASGATTFTNDVGVKTFSVAQGASATLNGGVDLAHANAEAQIAGALTLNGNRNFAAKLSGAGTLSTNGDVNFSSDASAFSGTTKVASGTFTVSEKAKHGSGTFDVAGTLALVGDRTFENAMLGTGALDIVSGNLTFTKNVGTAVFDISEGASATFAGTSDGFAGKLTGTGALTMTQNFVLDGDASGFRGKTSVTSGTFTVAENAKLGTGDFEIAGTLALNGNRTFANATSGDGKLEIASGATTFTNDVGVKTFFVKENATAILNTGVGLSNENASAQVDGVLVLSGKREVAFPASGSGKISLSAGADVSFKDAIVDVKTLSVENGAKLRGNVMMTYDVAPTLNLSGELELNLENEEKIVLGGGLVHLEKDSLLTLQGVAELGKLSRSHEMKIEVLEAGKFISIFEDGKVQGDVEAFLGRNSVLSDIASKSLVIYDLSNGLSLQIAPGVDENVNVGVEEFSRSYLDWAMKDISWTFDRLQSGFWNLADPIFFGGNDPLLNALLSGDAETARSILDRLSPKSYAAMFAVSAEAFHADVRSVSARLEQRRYDGFSKKAQWEFFAQAQGNSVENDTATDSATFDFDTTGVLAGGDYKPQADTIVGFAFGADKGEADIHNGGGKIESSDFRLTGYVGETFAGHFYVNAGAQLGYASYDIKRKTDYGNMTGETDGLNVGVFAETGALLPIASAHNLYAMPYVGLAYTHSQVEAFEERGGDKAFDVAEMTGDSLRARAGCGFSWGFDLAGTAWRLGLDVAYSYDFLGDEVDVDVMTRGGDKISETAKAMPESVFSVGPTLNIDLSSVISLYGNYTFNSGTDSYVNHSANLGFRMRF